MSVRGAPRLFRFGVFEADLENARLTRKGVRIRLQEQPFTILKMLLERCGQIVTREELRQRLWPEGTYVGFDGSLNAALNRLRTALDDDADNPRFIETVPKRGYRFIAPITVEPSPGIAEAEVLPPVPSAPLGVLNNQLPVQPPASPSRRFSLHWAAALGAVVLVIAPGAFIAVRKRVTKSAPPSVQATVDIGSLRRSVAVLGFQNASGRASDAWLSTALAEMLRTELGAGGQLRVVPGENIAQFRATSPWSETDSLSQQTTSRIGKALDSALLVLGSFAAVGDLPSGSVRVDFRLQDAQTGEILYEGAESGSEKQFFGLVATVGTDLRERLGLPMISESEEAGVVSSLPSDPDANRFYSLGLEKLREEDVAAAKDLFLQAEQIAPNFPLVHLMLSRAWASLGYDKKSRIEAKTAFDLSGNLPDTDRLLIQGAYYDSLHDRDRAIAAYRALFSVHPDSIDYGMQLFNALHAAARREEALAVIRQLRKLPSPASESPRLDFAQYLVVSATNADEAQPFLGSAIAKAAEQGQKLLYARFRLSQCIAEVYGPHPQGGVAHCQEAYDILMAAGNQLLAADALRTIGDRRGSKGDYNGARELYGRALALLTPMGEHEKTGVVLNNMAITYENQGQIAQSEKLFRQAAETWTECGDLENAAVAIGNLGDVLMERGQLREAEKQYERARKQIELTDPNGGAYELYSIATIRLEEGDMAGAKHLGEQAMTMARDAKNVSDIAAANEVMGDMRMAADDLPGARESFEQARSILQEKQSAGGVAEMEASLAGIAIEEGRFSEAEQGLRKSLGEFHAENAALDEIRAEVDLSRALLREGKIADARQIISDAARLSASSRDPSLKLPVAILDARIEAAELVASTKQESKPDLSEPRRKLLSVISTARQLDYYGIECDARLALAELEIRENRAAAGAHLAALAREAHEHGLDLVSRKATALENSSALSANRSRLLAPV
jgi:DNA-binding winged helix-turn-helix (wHTH) protein/tetratricopeptide (TPR) repeat protein/TolB-like protein